MQHRLSGSYPENGNAPKCEDLSPLSHFELSTKMVSFDKKQR